MNGEFDVVLKKPFKSFDKHYYELGLRKNMIAIFMSNEFNKAMRNKGFSENEQFFFTRVVLIRVGSEYYFIEGYINGSFEKYTSNSSLVKESVPLATAFSHFTWHYSDGKYMVADLQGVNNLLTDPVVHTQSGEFYQHADLAQNGIVAFFKHHKCNEYCEKLGLKPHDIQSTAPVVNPDLGEVKFSLEKKYKKCSVFLCNENSVKSLCETCEKKGIKLGGFF